MKAYVITSGGIFAAITVAHLMRIAMENRHLGTNLPFIMITLAAATLSVWAWRVLRRLNK